MAALHERGVEDAYLYGADDDLAGGLGAFFLLTEPPERYGLPANADSPIQQNVLSATAAALGAGLVAAAAVAASFVAGRSTSVARGPSRSFARRAADLMAGGPRRSLARHAADFVAGGQSGRVWSRGS